MAGAEFETLHGPWRNSLVARMTRMGFWSWACVSIVVACLPQCLCTRKSKQGFKRGVTLIPDP